MANGIVNGVGAGVMVGRQALTLGNGASPFGCCYFFDACADGIFSLYYRGGLDLLDALGFNVSIDCYRSIDFISYVRPEQVGGVDTTGVIADPCADPHGVEIGACHLYVDNFGLYGRESQARNVYKPERMCKTAPRFFFDGTPVTSESQWDMFFTMDQLLNDLRVALITDNSLSGAGHFDGLQRWVRTGYDCSSLDSYVVDWNGNAMDGTGGGVITINGVPANLDLTGANFDLIEFLLDLNRNINSRITWSPLLKGQMNRGVGKILLLPSFTARCLLDFYACWSVCPGATFEIITKNLGEIRELRRTLNGGLFGHGRIWLDDEEISLLNYDWGMINGPTTGDMYLLTLNVGAQRIWEGEHISADQAIKAITDAGFASGVGDYTSLDGGRVLAKGDFENLCMIKKLWMAPRLFCFAPWAQIRFQDVVCRTPSGPLSPNPADTSYYPLDSFSAAECP
jgi:hypothetical protein